MNRLKKIQLILRTLLRQPASLNKVLNESEEWRIKVERKGYGRGLPVLSIFELLSDHELVADPYLFLDGGSLPTDLALLRHLAGKASPCRYFEIGTWRGESAANVAQVADECFTLNLAATDMQQYGMPEARTKQLGLLSHAFPNIVHLSGDSKTFNYDQFDQPFDLIFIDGDHHYAQVKNDTEKVYKHLTHPGTIIAWHDYACHPEEVRYEVLAGILDGLPSSEYANLYHVSHTKTAVLLKGMQSKCYLDLTIPPKHAFSLRMHRAPLRDA